MAPYAGAVAPTDWLLCYGQAVSRTTYALLFAAIGTVYGVGDGSTTFNLPDVRGRLPAGKDNMGGSAAGRLTVGGSGIAGATLGASGGTETHTLTTAQLASHQHTVNQAMLGLTTSATSMVEGGDPGGGTLGPIATSSVGSGAAHNNAQPTLICNYIIKL